MGSKNLFFLAPHGSCLVLVYLGEETGQFPPFSMSSQSYVHERIRVGEWR